MTFIPDFEYIPAWIGLNKLLQGNWSWVDGTVCDGSCQDLPFWKNEEIFRRRVDCAIIDSVGDFDIEDCKNEDKDIVGYVCNAIPSVDYICVKKDDVWSFVLEYQNVYQYKYDILLDESVYTLAWNDTDFYWRLYRDNGSISMVGLCTSDIFVLPSECNSWQFQDNDESLTFHACPC